MIIGDIKRSKSVRFYLLLGAALLLVGCGLAIVRPGDGDYTRRSTVGAEVKLMSSICGAPFLATLDGNDVTNKFAPPHPGVYSPLSAPLYDLAPGPHTLTATADMEKGFPIKCEKSTSTVNFIVGELRDTNYMVLCRLNNVPIPPDWAESGTPWIYQGDLSEILLVQQLPGSVWTYSDPRVRGACIALARHGGGDSFGVICQSAATGHACFWQTSGWKGKALQISRLVDGANLEREFPPCTECHRGNNVFLFTPDDPVWEKILRGPLVTSPGSTFTTRVEASSDMRTVTLPNGASYTYPRYIPISGGPAPGWQNPFPSSPVGCMGGCHENQRPGIEIPVRQPRQMPPACAAGSPATDPARNCYG